MSGTVAEALLATGSKKVPLLPPPPKVKKEPKTYRFDLKLRQSNDEYYPEYSWTELVRQAKQKELKEKAEKGNPVLDPFASDDEEDLKAMAAKFEAKYNTTTASPAKKKKRRAEDFIDRGAGYDESDPFIDNSDVYDEVVPPDLQTQLGGFYINSGSLDFKAVELSEDEEDSISHPPKKAKTDKPKDRLSSLIKTNQPIQKVKNKVGRPPGVLGKKSIVTDKVKMAKKLLGSPGLSDGKIVKPVKKISLIRVDNFDQKDVQNRSENSKPEKAAAAASSSSSSSSDSSSSDDSSSSSDSESSSAEESNEKKEKETKQKDKDIKNLGPPKQKPSANLSVGPPKLVPNPVRMSNMPSVPQNAHPFKRLKTKNVPLNPKLHPNLPTSAGMSLSSSSPSIVSPNNSISQQQHKVLNKDLIKGNTNGAATGAHNTSPRVQSPSGLPLVPTSSAAIRVPLPKSISSPSISTSTGLSISPAPPQLPKQLSSTSVLTKPKTKPKQPTTITPQMTHLEVFQTIANNYPTSLPNLPNISFNPTITSNPSLLKSGMNISMNPQKSMPNLKKLVQSQSSTSPSDKADRVRLKQAKLAGQKPVKTKPKMISTNLSTLPSQQLSSLASGNSNLSHADLSSLTTPYKPPPPLGGPGVEASKHRTTPTSQGTVGITKASPTPRSVSSNQLLSNAVSMALSSGNQINSNSFVNSSFSSVISSSANTLLANSIPSNLTVQRLSQSLTITPSAHTSYGGGDRMTPTNNSGKSSSQSSQYTVGLTDIKPVKHSTAFDVSSLLQNPMISFSGTGSSGSSVITMTNTASTSKLSTSKVSNNIDRDLPPRKQ